jgi:hypothetical protein
MNALSPILVSAGHEVMDRFGLFVNALGPIEVVVAGRVILDRLQPLNTPSPIDVSGPNNWLLVLFPILDKLLHPLNVLVPKSWRLVDNVTLSIPVQPLNVESPKCVTDGIWAWIMFGQLLNE